MGSWLLAAHETAPLQILPFPGNALQAGSHPPPHLEVSIAQSVLGSGGGLAAALGAGGVLGSLPLHHLHGRWGGASAMVGELNPGSTRGNNRMAFTPPLPAPAPALTLIASCTGVPSPTSSPSSQPLASRRQSSAMSAAGAHSAMASDATSPAWWMGGFGAGQDGPVNQAGFMRAELQRSMGPGHHHPCGVTVPPRTGQQRGAPQRIQLTDQVCVWWVRIGGGIGRAAGTQAYSAPSAVAKLPQQHLLHSPQPTPIPSHTSALHSPISTGQACSTASTSARGTWPTCCRLPACCLPSPLLACLPPTPASPPAAAAATAAEAGVAGAWGDATGGCLAPAPRMGPLLPWLHGAAGAGAGAATAAAASGTAATAGWWAPAPLMGSRRRGALGCAAAAAPRTAGSGSELPPVAAASFGHAAPAAARGGRATFVRLSAGISSSSSSCSVTKPIRQLTTQQHCLGALVIRCPEPTSL